MNTVPTNMPVFAEYDVTEEVFEVALDKKGLQYEVQRSGSNAVVATLPFGLRPQEKQLATLFAHAPDMLNALEYVLGELDLNDEMQQYIGSVIANAKGE
jgi:hypothetical protein